jgi:transcriptional regulator with XRE-family HTH domain
MMSISVQKLCKDKGLSLLSLAERSGLDLKRLQSIYLGRWTPSPNERERIAQALDTSSDDIAWEHSTPVEHFYGSG